MILNAVTAGLLALSGSPAVSAPVAADPVTLVVGYRTGAPTTVEVPAGQVSQATKALRADPAVTYVEPDHIARIATNDPSYSGQWGIARTGVDVAWGTTHGASGVVVAVLDTGVTAIPDLAGRLLPGKDFVNGDNDATDDEGHGTQAAGVIAAAGNNGIGVAGICWNCRILPVKVLGSNGMGSYSDIGAGIRWAADQGADVISLSLGAADDSQLLRDAAAYASAKGALVIAAAGNSGKTVKHYPAAIPSVLAVGGSTQSDERYPWSNYGSDWVDIAAPGCNLAQSMKQVAGQYCGTSSATPFVAGVAALLASTTPKPDAATIRSALESTAVKIGGDWVGSGRVDAGRALAVEKSMPLPDDTVAPVTSFSSPVSGALVRGKVAVTARATDDVDVAKVELLVNGKVVGTDRSSPYAFTWDSGAIRGASVTLGLKAYDRGGNVASATRTLRVDNGAPTVKITSGPANGTRKIRGTKYVTATASDANAIRRLELQVNGKVVQTYAGTSHRFAVATARYGKTISVRVRAYDRAGNVASTPVRKWYR
ncbi:S8 family serine peptidase [Winogradskya humida]|uniref:Peptidase S8/S53 domain-containing protein n=1 Tax=Winogradskya humida TaxID=113566 RepID=A0ABQ3ZLK6_9ACTN|nr:S8 family serine peptidase [Actinoplanes humidus]GIE19072.1 hypothetical protein Ahu01nite_021740 [Actinoplanes humidus]